MHKTEESRVRVGLVGAGANTKVKHIPGFRSIEGVGISCVVNRRRDSSERVANQFNIPVVADSWQQVVASPEVDAICIGTWPYLHSPVTCAALESGKHVLTEARMAMNLEEARSMLDASERHPELITQIVPSPIGLRVGTTVRELIEGGYLGELLAVKVRDVGPDFADLEGPLQWRQRKDLSGLNCLVMGIWYETVMRWVGHVRSVLASAKICVPKRKDLETGKLVAVEVPDHIDVLVEFEGGGCGNFQFSSITGLGRESSVYLYGSEGTLGYNAISDTLWGGRRGEAKLAEIPIAEDKAGHWRVEEEFINAVRGREKVTLTDFETGVRYMEFTEAVYLSWTEGVKIQLPL